MAKAKKPDLSQFGGPDPCPVVLHPALKNYLTYRLYKTAIRLRGEVNEALSKHGLLGVQLGIMRVLDEGGPASQVELGRSLGIDKASMVKLLDGIEAGGYVVREADKKDRRVKWIVVTAKGKRMIKTAGELRQAVEDKFFAPLSAAERAKFMELLGKISP